MQRKIIIIGNDSATLIKAENRESAVGCVYLILVSPRPNQYSYWFCHLNDHVTLLATNGAISIDVEGQIQRVEKGEFTDIKAGQRYRFRGLEHQPVAIYIFANSESVAQSWREVGSQVEKHLVIGRDGSPRYC